MYYNPAIDFDVKKEKVSFKDKVDFRELSEKINKKNDNSDNAIIIVLKEIRNVLGKIYDSLNVNTFSTLRSEENDTIIRKYNIDTDDNFERLLFMMEQQNKTNEELMKYGFKSQFDWWEFLNTNIPDLFDQLVAKTKNVFDEYIKTVKSGKGYDFLERRFEKDLKEKETKIGLSVGMLKQYTLSANTILKNNIKTSPVVLSNIFLASIYDVLRYLAIDVRAQALGDSPTALMDKMFEFKKLTFVESILAFLSKHGGASILAAIDPFIKTAKFVTEKATSALKFISEVTLTSAAMGRTIYNWAEKKGIIDKIVEGYNIVVPKVSTFFSETGQKIVGFLKDTTNAIGDLFRNRSDIPLHQQILSGLFTFLRSVRDFPTYLRRNFITDIKNVFGNIVINLKDFSSYLKGNFINDVKGTFSRFFQSFKENDLFKSIKESSLVKYLLKDVKDTFIGDFFNYFKKDVKDVFQDVKHLVKNISDSNIVGYLKRIYSNWAERRENKYVEKIASKLKTSKPPEVITSEAISKVPNILEQSRVIQASTLEVSQNIFNVLNELLAATTGSGIEYNEYQSDLKSARTFNVETGELQTKEEFEEFKTERKQQIQNEIFKDKGFLYKLRHTVFTPSEREAAKNQRQIDKVFDAVAPDKDMRLGDNFSRVFGEVKSSVDKVEGSESNNILGSKVKDQSEILNKIYQAVTLVNSGLMFLSNFSREILFKLNIINYNIENSNNILFDINNSIIDVGEKISSLEKNDENSENIVDVISSYMNEIQRVGIGKFTAANDENSRIIVNARSEGGPISAGQIGLVGEKGMELIIPDKDVRIKANKETNQILNDIRSLPSANDVILEDNVTAAIKDTAFSLKNIENYYKYSKHDEVNVESKKSMELVVPDFNFKNFEEVTKKILKNLENDDDVNNSLKKSSESLKTIEYYYKNQNNVTTLDRISDMRSKVKEKDGKADSVIPKIDINLKDIVDNKEKDDKKGGFLPKLIKGALTGVLGMLGFGGAALAVKGGAVLAGIGSMLFAGLLAGGKLLLGGGALAGKLLAGLAGGGKLIAGAAALPVILKGLLIAGVGIGAFYLTTKIIDYFKNDFSMEKVTEGIKNFWDNLDFKEIGKSILEGIKFIGKLVFDGFKFAGKFLFEGIKIIGGLIFDGIKLVTPLIVKAVKALPGFLFDSLKFLGGLLIKGVTTVIKALPGLLFEGIKLIGKLIFNVAKRLPGLIFDGMKLITKLIAKGTIAVVKKLPGLLFEGIKLIGKLIFKGVTTVVKTLPGLLFDGLKLIGKLLFNVATKLPAFIFDGIKLIFKGLTKLPVMLFEGLKNISGFLFESLKEIPGVLLKGLSNISGFLLDAFKGVPELLIDGAKNLWNGLKEIPGLIFERIKLIPSLVFDGLKNVTSVVYESIVSGIKKLPGLIYDGIKGITSFISDGLKLIPDFIIDGIKKLPSLIIDGVMIIPNLIIDGLKSIPNLLLDGLKSIPNLILEGIKSIPSLIFKGLQNVFGRSSIQDRRDQLTVNNFSDEKQQQVRESRALREEIDSVPRRERTERDKLLRQLAELQENYTTYNESVRLMNENYYKGNRREGDEIAEQISRQHSVAARSARRFNVALYRSGISEEELNEIIEEYNAGHFVRDDFNVERKHHYGFAGSVRKRAAEDHRKLLESIEGRAEGGPVSAGQIVEVNENTPKTEYFVASAPGYVARSEDIDEIVKARKEMSTTPSPPPEVTDNNILSGFTSIMGTIGSVGSDFVGGIVGIGENLADTYKTTLSEHRKELEHKIIERLSQETPMYIHLFAPGKYVIKFMDGHTFVVDKNKMPNAFNYATMVYNENEAMFEERLSRVDPETGRTGAEQAERDARTAQVKQFSVEHLRSTLATGVEGITMSLQGMGEIFKLASDGNFLADMLRTAETGIGDAFRAMPSYEQMNTGLNEALYGKERNFGQVYSGYDISQIPEAFREDVLEHRHKEITGLETNKAKIEELERRLDYEELTSEEMEGIFELISILDDQVRTTEDTIRRNEESRQRNLAYQEYIDSWKKQRPDSLDIALTPDEVRRLQSGQNVDDIISDERKRDTVLYLQALQDYEGEPDIRHFHDFLERLPHNREAYLVGEKGPEIFQPINDGMIIPNDYLKDPESFLSQYVTPRKEGGPVIGWANNQGLEIPSSYPNDPQEFISRNFVISDDIIEAAQQNDIANMLIRRQTGLTRQELDNILQSENVKTDLARVLIERQSDVDIERLNMMLSMHGQTNPDLFNIISDQNDINIDDIPITSGSIGASIYTMQNQEELRNLEGRLIEEGLTRENVRDVIGHARESGVIQRREVDRTIFEADDRYLFQRFIDDVSVTPIGRMDRLIGGNEAKLHETYSTPQVLLSQIGGGIAAKKVLKKGAEPFIAQHILAKGGKASSAPLVGNLINLQRGVSLANAPPLPPPITPPPPPPNLSGSAAVGSRGIVTPPPPNLAVARGAGSSRVIQNVSTGVASGRAVQGATGAASGRALQGATGAAATAGKQSKVLAALGKLKLAINGKKIAVAAKGTLAFFAKPIIAAFTVALAIYGTYEYNRNPVFREEVDDFIILAGDLYTQFENGQIDFETFARGVLDNAPPSIREAIAQTGQFAIDVVSHDDVRHFMQVAKETFAPIITPIIDKGKEVTKDIISAVEPYVKEGVHHAINFGKEFVKTVSPIISPIVDSVSDFVGKAASEIGKAATFIGGLIAIAAKPVIDAITPHLKTFYDNFVSPVIGGLKKAYDVIRPVISQVWEGIKWILDKLGAALGWVVDGVKWIGNKIGRERGIKALQASIPILRESIFFSNIFRRATDRDEFETFFSRRRQDKENEQDTLDRILTNTQESISRPVRTEILDKTESDRTTPPPVEDDIPILNRPIGGAVPKLDDVGRIGDTSNISNEIARLYSQPSSEVATSGSGLSPTEVNQRTTKITPLSSSQKDTMKGVYDAFINAGFSHNQAVALGAEVGRENDFNQRYIFGVHSDAANNAINLGFFSWQGSRARNLRNELTKQGLMTPEGNVVRSQESLNTMAQFARKEMYGTYRKRIQEFLDNPNIDFEKSAEILGRRYIVWAYGQSRLRSGKAFDWRSHDAKRRGYAQQLDRLGGGSGVLQSPREDLPEQSDIAGMSQPVTTPVMDSIMTPPSTPVGSLPLPPELMSSGNTGFTSSPVGKFTPTTQQNMSNFGSLTPMQQNLTAYNAVNEFSRPGLSKYDEFDSVVRNEDSIETSSGNIKPLRSLVNVHGKPNIEGLNPRFQQQFAAMLTEHYAKGGKRVQVNSAFRTYVEQAALFKKYGPGRAARPGRSRHESGVAIDINSVDGKALESSGLLRKYGFGRPLSHEPWHIEPLDRSRFNSNEKDSPARPVGVDPNTISNEEANFMSETGMHGSRLDAELEKMVSISQAEHDMNAMGMGSGGYTPTIPSAQIPNTPTIPSAQQHVPSFDGHKATVGINDEASIFMPGWARGQGTSNIQNKSSNSRGELGGFLGGMLSSAVSGNLSVGLDGLINSSNNLPQRKTTISGGETRHRDGSISGGKSPSNISNQSSNIFDMISGAGLFGGVIGNQHQFDFRTPGWNFNYKGATHTPTSNVSPPVTNVPIKSDFIIHTPTSNVPVKSDFNYNYEGAIHTPTSNVSPPVTNVPIKSDFNYKGVIHTPTSNVPVKSDFNYKGAIHTPTSNVSPPVTNVPVKSDWGFQYKGATYSPPKAQDIPYQNTTTHYNPPSRSSPKVQYDINEYQKLSETKSTREANQLDNTSFDESLSRIENIVAKSSGDDVRRLLDEPTQQRPTFNGSDAGGGSDRLSKNSGQTPYDPFGDKLVEKLFSIVPSALFNNLRGVATDNDNMNYFEAMI